MTTAPKGLSPQEKLATEFGPLALWLGAYFAAPRFLPIPEGREIFYALGVFMAAFAVAFAYTFIKEKKVSPVLLVSGIIVAITGGLTFLFQDRIFTYIKPTLTNTTFALILTGGLLSGRLFIKMLFAQAFQMPDPAWRTLTWRFVGFFIFLAVLNEVVWRYVTYGMGCDPTVLPNDQKCDGEGIWVNFKAFGVLPLTLLFTGLQAPFLMKHMVDEKPNAAEETPEADKAHALTAPPPSDTSADGDAEAPPRPDAAQ
ncbi:MAG: inner membrane-spanning protein YciB [Pseudomonadota bacterium]